MNEMIDKTFSVTRYGQKLPQFFYSWNPETRTFSSNKDNLVLNFAGWYDMTFVTGDNCVFITGSRCNFQTGHKCTFRTGYYCMFQVGSQCTIDVEGHCKVTAGVGTVVIDRMSDKIFRLNSSINKFESEEKQVLFGCITVFKNNDHLEFSMNFKKYDLINLKYLLSKETYGKLLREVFEKMT